MRSFPSQQTRRLRLIISTHPALSRFAAGDIAFEDMVLKPAHIAQNPYLYPVGNTPAVCFTDTLPPEVDAKVLLLGCGDIRNILCTAHSGAGTGM